MAQPRRLSSPYSVCSIGSSDIPMFSTPGISGLHINDGEGDKTLLWQGGKANTKKFHLVNWNTVRSPHERGGLEIRDSLITNQAMGAKILWRYISGKAAW